VADRHEDAVHRDARGFAGDRVFQGNGGDAPCLRIAVNLLDVLVQDEVDFRVAVRAVEHDLRCAELFTPVRDRHGARELREKRRFFHRGVAAADDEHFLVLEEEAVARCAGRHAVAHEPGLRGDAEQPRGRAGSDDQRVARVLVCRRIDPQQPARQVHALHVAAGELRPEPSGLRAKALHHLRPHQSLGKTGIVLYLRRDRQLAAGLRAFDHERVNVRARVVQRRRQAGRPGAEYDDSVMFAAHRDRARMRRPACRFDGRRCGVYETRIGHATRRTADLAANGAPRWSEQWRE
jgi:hypothetical protein